MKKLLVLLCSVVLLLLLYDYQKPILNSGEAVVHAVECLNHPPEEFGVFPDEIALESITSENVYTHLLAQDGFYAQLTNKRKWEVKIVSPERESTVVLDAYSGACLGVYGPLH